MQNLSFLDTIQNLEVVTQPDFERLVSKLEVLLMQMNLKEIHVVENKSCSEVRNWFLVLEINSCLSHEDVCIGEGGVLVETVLQRTLCVVHLSRQVTHLRLQVQCL